MTVQQKFNYWLDQIIRSEKPGNEVVAYWFGIFETDQGYETSLTGSKTYDEHDDDWACNIDFAPADKYLLLGQPGREWEDILDDVKGYLIEYFKTETFRNSFLNNSQVIACGFEDGDIYRLK